MASNNNNNNIVSITFKAFNKDFNDAMKGMNQETAALKAQMKLQQEQMKHTATESQKLEAKMTSLEQIYQAAQRQTQATADALARAKALWGENSQEVKKYQQQLLRHQTAEQQAANAITETAQALSRAQQAVQDQGTSMTRLQQLFDATGTRLQDFTDILGQDLVHSITMGEASARDLDQAFGRVSRSALGAGTDLNEVRTILNRLGQGGNLDDVTRDLRRVSANAKQAKEEVKKLAKELTSAATAAGAVGTASLAGLVVGTEDVSMDLAMLKTQISSMSVSTGVLTKATKSQLETMAKGFGESENALSKSLANRESAMEASGAAQTKELEKAMEQQTEAASKGYEQQEKSLEKKLSKEYDAIVKNYDKQQKELEKALDKEVEAFEKASEEKIALIDKEYTERLKLINEEEYNRLKAIDAQIEGLNARTDAEDRAIKARENNEKRAELQAKVRQAKTFKDRQDAQKDLSDFEERLRLEAIREERTNLIDDLKGQKDQIKEETDAQKDALKIEIDDKKSQQQDINKAELDALKERQQVQKDAFGERKELELKAIQETHKAQQDALQERNEASMKAIEDEQEARKAALETRLSSEVTAVADAHAAELESFKEMNAQKLKESEKGSRPLHSETVEVDLELGDLTEARSNFASVKQDVDQVTEAMGNLIRAGYTSEDQLNEVSKLLSGAIVSGGNTFTIEGIAESIATTSQLGEMTGQFTDLFEKNISEVGMSVEEFNEKISTMGTVGERSNFIMQTLADMGMGDLYDSYAETNPEIVDAAAAQVRLMDASVALADELRPLVTQVKEILAGFMEWASENPVIAKTLLVVSAAITAIGVVMGIVSGVVMNIIGLFKALGGAGGSGGIIGKLGSLFVNLASKILPALRIAFGALSGPIGIVILILTTVLPLIVKHWDSIVAFFVDMGTKIKDALEKPYNDFKIFIGDVWQGIRDKLKEWIEKVKGLLNFKDTIDAAKTKFGEIKDALVKPVENARDAISEIIGKIKGFFDFKFKWPELKVPKIKVTKGSLNPLKWFSEGFPEVDIQWFKNGGLMNKPTIFGRNGNTMLAGGEAGPEAILPLNERVFAAIGKGIYQATGDRGGDSHTYNYQGMLDGAIINVREEADIKKVSRELFILQQQKNRGGGQQ